MKPNKYQPLGDFLHKQATPLVAMSFAEIEAVIGTSLPDSAHRYRAWWSNNPSNSVMTKAWLDAGFQSEAVDMEGKTLVFRRVNSGTNSAGAGISEAPRSFTPAESLENKAPRRSPLFGALKGTFTIDPGWDLTKPSLDPEEWAEWEASLDRKADLIEQGLSGKSR